MKKLSSHQEGSHVVAVAILIVVIGIAGIAGWRVLTANKDKDADSTSGAASTSQSQTDKKSDEVPARVKWSWTGSGYIATSTAPACPEPLVFETAPTDMSKVTSVLYPGQTRGGNYKPHGGLRADESANEDIKVYAIMDGFVESGSRYIEAGEVQYMFTITNNCGIAYRYDHLLTLSPELQKVADTLPEAKVDDSRTTFIESPVYVRAGDEIATAVGFKKSGNVGFDLGVYDYRTVNQSAKDPAFASRHSNFIAQAGHAVCWLDMFMADVTQKMTSLPAGDMQQGKTSDYCN